MASSEVNITLSIRPGHGWQSAKFRCNSQRDKQLGVCVRCGEPARGKFCTADCQRRANVESGKLRRTSGQRGANNPNWKGGTFRAGRKFKAERPEAVKAHRAVLAAVRSGKLVRPEFCSACSKFCKPDAHHTDYSKPLSVEWLCRACHVRLTRPLLLTPDEAASYLRFKTRTAFDRFLRRSQIPLPCRRDSRGCVYDAREIDIWMSQFVVNGPASAVTNASRVGRFHSPNVGGNGVPV